MSRSRLRNKWMRKKYAQPGRSYMRKKMKDPNHNPHRQDEAPKNHPSRYITTHCSADVRWLQESTSFGGHNIPKGGHRRVSGLVRARVKEDERKQIESELKEENNMIMQGQESYAGADISDSFLDYYKTQ